MFSEYKNILANKFMRDTNYIIIKDTDDIEELERQWELFKSCLTVRQQRLSDDRSIEIWNMTNQEHYETLKKELMEELETKLNIDEPVDSIESEDSDDILSNDDFEPDEEFKNYVNIPNDEEIPDEEYDINEPIKEDSTIPTDGKEHVIGDDKDELGLNLDRVKDAQADQYEIDSNINIIGSIRGKTPEEHLENLEKAYAKWNSQNQDHRKKSDDKCREIYGMSNIDRYNMLKASIYKIIPTEKLTAADVDANTVDNIQLPKDESSFIYQVYRNMQVLNEQESNKQKQHRRFNDTPYFTPTEMIDLGVHDNDNFYSFKADNDGLIQGTKIPTWFDSYKDMCLDHIFEDYTKEWIDTLDMLYSDFEQIKESGNEEAILARKQSILDLGWNPEIPFNRRNRLKASKRVNKLLDKHSPMNLFINLDKVVPDDAISDEPVIENAKSDTHQPIYMVFVQGKAPIISSSIKKVTHSPYSHSGIAFDHTLDTVHSYNMIPDVGLVRETLQGYKDSVITVMAFFAPNKIAQAMKDYVQDFWYNSKKTVYDFGIIFNKLINKNARVVEDKYHQVCSTFVDAVLKSGNVVIDKTANVPSPAELYNSAKTMPNKIIEVYTGPANEYNANKVGKKIKKLLNKGSIQSIEESASSISTQSDSVNKEETITEGIHDIMNSTNPFSTKTFYHISFDDDLDDEILKPRIPSWITNEVKKNPNFIKELEKLKDSNSTSGTGFEEYMTPRVCFSPSIEGCLNAIINEKGRMHLHNETLYVYIPEKPIKEYKTKTNRQILKDGDIFDANVTQEMWILEPVKLKYVGSIVVDKITGEHIKKFANNKNKTNIKYDYKWHWFHKVKYRYNQEKNKFVTEASISDSKRVAIDIRDKTIAYLKKIVESDEYQQKWGKFKFFKDNINIYPTEYGDYKASINICDCSPWSVNADEYYDNPKEKQLFHKWYYDLLNKGKNFINNKFSSTLDKYDIYVSLGDEDECTIYLESKLNEKHPILFKAKSILAKESVSILNEAISDLESAESNDIYHNIEDWESGKSNVLWVTGLSGSGKSTISREISINNIEHVELDNLQRAKIDNWDHTGSTLMDDYIKSKGGLTNIFSYVNDLDEVTWKDLVSNETECPKQFNDFFEYIIKYANTHKIKRFVIEGIQIAMCAKDTMINKISKYPVIIKMNGPLKTEFRREKRTIQTGIDKNDTFINIMKKVTNRHKNWWQQDFYMDDWKEINYFRTHIGESASVLNEVKQFPVEFDKEGNLIIYKCRTGSISYGDEIADSVKLLESYRNANNVEGIKYELAKLWFINDSIEKRLKKRLTNDEYKELINQRAICLNVFKLNLEYVMKAEQGFNFSDYYNSTPFSDNSIKITANTIKYSMKALMQI